MNTEAPASSPKPFFKWAARYSLVAPLATAAVTLFTVFAVRGAGYEFVNFVLSCGMLIVITSLISGVVSFFGVMGRGVRILVWTAAAGILSSCVMGFGIFVLAIGN